MVKQDDEWRVHDALFRKMQGATEFVAWYGSPTAFHDAEIERIEIGSSGTVVIDIHCERLRSTGTDDRTAEKRIVLTLLDVASLELSQLNAQNVIFSLTLRPAAPPGRGQPQYGRAFRTDDIEIEIEPSVGIGGTIRCGSASISLKDWRAA